MPNDSKQIDVDEFQFVLRDASRADLTGIGYADSLVTFEPNRLGFVVVHTEDQWGQVAVRGEYVSEPAEVGLHWAEVSEISVSAIGGIVIGELFGPNPLVLVTGSGSYRVRICASGPEREEFLIQAWKAKLEPGATLRSIPTGFADEGPHDNEADLRRRGAAAAGAVARDVTGTSPVVRTLGSSNSSAFASRVFRGDRAKLFAGFESMSSWLTDEGSASRPVVGTDLALYGSSDSDQDAITGGEDSLVRCTWLRIDRAEHLSATWNWYPDNGDPAARPLREPRSTIRVDFQPDAATPRHATTVTVTHAGIPHEWVADLETYWAWQLLRADVDFELGR